MSDQIKPGDEAPAPDPIVPEPASPPPEPTPQDPPKTDDPSEPMVEQKRFTGAIQKIQTLTEELRSKDQEAAALNSQLEQLKTQQAVKDAEAQAGYGERDKKLEAALLEKTTIEAEAATLKSMMRKIEIAKELGHPELVEIIDTIPTFDDEALQKKAMEDILGFSEKRVQEREKSLLSGITPAVSPTPAPGEVLPATNEAWTASIEAEPDQTKRTVLFDKWWDWRQKNDPSKQG